AEAASRGIDRLSLHVALPIYEFSAMGAEQFGRERLGIWNEAKAETVIAPALWREGNITEDEIPDAEKISLAVEVSADGQYSTLADRKSTRLNSSHVKTSYAVF